MLVQTQTGPSLSSNGSSTTLRGGKLGDGIFSELHGRFYEQTYNGNVFSAASAAGGASIANATFTTADALSGTLATAATSTPIIGLWNPLTSGRNAVLLQAVLNAWLTASTATGTQGLVWCVYTGNAAITVGSQQTPVSHNTLTATGSQMKGLNGLALTGLAAVGTLLSNSCLCAGPQTNYSQVGTAVGFPNAGQGPTVENLDGSIIVPPGGIIGLFATATPVAIGAAGSLTWEEVPV